MTLWQLWLLPFLKYIFYQNTFKSFMYCTPHFTLLILVHLDFETLTLFKINLFL